MQRSLLSAALLLPLFGMGCGSGNSTPKYDLKGTVTFKGQPAQNVQIELHSSAGQVYTAQTKDDGSFLMTQVIPAEMKVAVKSMGSGPAYQATGGTVQAATKSGNMYGKGKSLEGAKADKPVERKMSDSDFKGPVLPTSTKLPAKYADPAKSGLTWSVTEQATTKDFSLNE